MGNAKIIPEKNTLLLPYQARWVKDQSRLKLMEKSRQIGISWASAYSLVRRKAKQGARLDAWVSSRDDIQARLFLEDCKGFAKLLQVAAEDLGEQVIDDKKSNAYVLRFANQLRINSMSSNPDAQAGKRGDRMLDEFALHQDPRKLYSIAYPGITWGGQLEIVSTHRGSANFFNELIREIKEKDNPKGFSLHTVTLEDALNQGFLYKLQSKLPSESELQDMDEAEYFDFIKSGCADEESFLQEYMCLPADDVSAFLSYDMIAACEYSREEESKEYGYSLEQLNNCKGSLFVGVDIGRTHDLTVIWVLEKLGATLYTRSIIELQNMKFSLQEAELYPILALPKMRRSCIDSTGLGKQFAERAREKFGKYRIEEVTFTPASKEELAYPFRSAFEDKIIKLPFNKFIRADLRAIKKQTTSAGNIRFSADRGKNGHSDRFWAGALAVHAGSSKVADTACKVESAGSKKSNEKQSYHYAGNKNYKWPY